MVARGPWPLPCDIAQITNSINNIITSTNSSNSPSTDIWSNVTRTTVTSKKISQLQIRLQLPWWLPLMVPMDLRSTKRIKLRVVTNREATRTKCFISKWRAISITISISSRLPYSHSSNFIRHHLRGKAHKQSISTKKASSTISTADNSRGTLPTPWWKQWPSSRNVMAPDWLWCLELLVNNSSKTQSCSSTLVEITIQIYHQFIVLKKSERWTALAAARKCSPHHWMLSHPCKLLRLSRW